MTLREREELEALAKAWETEHERAVGEGFALCAGDLRALLARHPEPASAALPPEVEEAMSRFAAACVDANVLGRTAEAFEARERLHAAIARAIEDGGKP
jgi:hypothetical protein